MDDNIALELLAIETNWIEPDPDGVSIRFSATPEGEEVYAAWPR